MKNISYIAELVASLQPAIDLVNSNQVRSAFAESLQAENPSSLLLEQALAAASNPLYDRPDLLQNIKPSNALLDQFADSLDYIQRYNIKTESLSALTEGISLACENINLPARLLYESSQIIANATQKQDNIFSTFTSNMENITISSDLESGGYIDLPEPVAKMFSDMDDSIELPPSNSEQIVRVDKTNHDTFIAVIGLLVAILSLFLSIVSDNSSTALSKQQHAERMQQDEAQHKELMYEERKQTKLLEKIYDALDSAPNSNEPPTEDIHKCTPGQPRSERI